MHSCPCGSLGLALGPNASSASVLRETQECFDGARHTPESVISTAIGIRR